MKGLAYAQRIISFLDVVLESSPSLVSNKKMSQELYRPSFTANKNYAKMITVEAGELT